MAGWIIIVINAMLVGMAARSGRGIHTYGKC